MAVRLLLLLLVPSVVAAWAGTSGHSHRLAASRSRPIHLAGPALNSGAIIEFLNNKKATVLGVVGEPDGKKKWKVTTSGGSTVSIAPQQVRLIVAPTPPKGVTPSSLEAAAEACTAAVEELWEMVVDEGAMALSELSELLLGDAAIEQRYSTYRLLGSSLYFRAGPAAEGGPTFTARSADEVHKLRLQADAVEAAERQVRGKR